jgi:Tfp pilus assembly protein PilF
MKIRNIAALLLGSCLVTFFCTTNAQAQGHTIRGKVRNSSGVNMPQTTVNLEGGNGGLINQTVTNNEGDFIFSGLEETSYLITISAPDYSPASERVDFVRRVSANDPGEMRTVEITLTRKFGPAIARPEVTFVQDVPKEARENFESGVKSLREGQAQDGIVKLQKAVSIFPDYFDARFLLASEYIKQQKLSEAIVELDNARRVNPKDDRVFQLFGLIMMKQQKYAVAARVFAEAARLNPRELQYLVSQGTALIDEAATINPNASPTAASEREYAFTEAEKVLARAYELSGQRLSTVHLQRARLYEKRGDRARAATELEKYLKQSPNEPRTTEIRNAIKKLREKS